MTITALERNLMTAFRSMQLERRKATTSWRQVMQGGGINTSIGPAMDILMDKVDEFVDIERWRNGDPRLGAASDIVSDTYNVKSYFYGFEITLGSWWEDWLRANASNANIAQFPGLNAERYNEANRVRRAIEEMERQIDNDFYVGHSKIAFTGMVDLDASPTTLVNDLKMVDGSGRAEFVDTLVDITSTAANDLTRGAQKVLVIGEDVRPWLMLPQDGTDRRGPSTMSFVNQLVDRVVEVQNTNMQGKAFVHWVAPDNVEVFDQTPGGIIVRAEQTRLSGTRVRGFAMWTAHEHRDKTVQVIDGLLS